jgi:hypothetical protein
MDNPFKPDDKVLTHRKGVEIEATVRTIWNHEVQVRAADGDLLWRTVKTVRIVTAPETDQPADTPPIPESPAEIDQDEPAQGVRGVEGPPTMAEPGTGEPAAVEPATMEPEPCVPVSEPSGQPAAPEQQQQPEKAAPKLKKRRKGILSKFIGSDFDQ